MHFLVSVCSHFIDNFSLECANTFENDYKLMNWTIYSIFPSNFWGNGTIEVRLWMVRFFFNSLSNFKVWTKLNFLQNHYLLSSNYLPYYKKRTLQIIFQLRKLESFSKAFAYSREKLSIKWLHTDTRKCNDLWEWVYKYEFVKSF